MPVFRREIYDRDRILDAAARASSRGKKHRAIALYRQVLSDEPQDAELHWKLAPLLAETGQHFDAYHSYETVAERFLTGGSSERALAVYREATRQLPREVRSWEAAARLQKRAGRQGEAIDTLLEGSRHFRKRPHRAQAVHLLRRARELDAWNFEVVVEQAKLLDRSGQDWEAGQLLESLADRVGGSRLRRVRAIQLMRSPTPAAWWRWLRQLASGDEDDAPAVAQGRAHRPTGVPLPVGPAR